MSQSYAVSQKARSGNGGRRRRQDEDQGDDWLTSPQSTSGEEEPSQPHGPYNRDDQTTQAIDHLRTFDVVDDVHEGLSGEDQDRIREHEATQAALAGPRYVETVLGTIEVGQHGPALPDVPDASTIIEMVHAGLHLWGLQARFEDVIILAPNAVAPPTCLQGPELKPAMTPLYAALTDTERDIAEAVATGVSGAFAAWQAMVTIPNLPLFPLLVAMQGPMAPPTTSVPIPLTSFASSMSRELIDPRRLTKRITDALPAPLATVLGEYVSAIAEMLTISFDLWLQTSFPTMLGMGPVVGPPLNPMVGIPFGPVMNGWVIGQPVQGWSELPTGLAGMANNRIAQWQMDWYR